jgi:hypothetical protein
VAERGKKSKGAAKNTHPIQIEGLWIASVHRTYYHVLVNNQRNVKIFKVM